MPLIAPYIRSACLLLCLLVGVLVNAQPPFTLPGVAGDGFVPDSSITACCQILRISADGNDQYPVQLGDYGGFHYVLSNTLIGGTSYGVLTKNHPSGAQVWRYRLETASVFSAFTFTDNGEFLIAGRTDNGGDNASLLVNVRAEGTAEWVRAYQHAGQEGFEAVMRDVDADQPDKYVVLGSYPKSQSLPGQFTTGLHRTTASAASFSYSKHYELLAAGAATVESQRWHTLLPLPGEKLLAVGETEGASPRGLIFTFDATGNPVAGKSSAAGIRYTDALRMPNGLIVIAGERSEAYAGDTVVTPALWLASSSLDFYDEIRWPEGLAGGISSLTYARVRDTAFVYMGAVTSAGNAAVVRLTIDSSYAGQTLTAGSPQQQRSYAATAAAGGPSPSDYYFIQRSAHTLDSVARLISGVQVKAARNGRYLLYAHARVLGTGSTHDIYYGRLSLDLSEPCVSLLDLVSLTTTVVSTDNRSLTTENSGLPAASGLAGSWQAKASNAEQRCEPFDVDGCSQAYPVATWGYFQLSPSADCAGMTLILEVSTAQGKTVFQRTVSGSQAVILDISDRPRGLYFIRWKDQAGNVLHTSSVLLS